MSSTRPLAVVWGERLRTARTDAGMTQAQLAHRIGISQYTISRLENGEHRPHDDTKFALAEVFGITVETLFPYTMEVAS